MSKTGRRDFIKLAGAGTMTVALTGSPAIKIFSSEKSDNNFNIEEQNDPWVELNMDHLASNVNEVRKRVGDRPIMAMVKCNAYGHGMLEIAKALQANSNIKHFGVVKVKEALSLRKNNMKGMILNVGVFNRNEAKELIKHDISQSVFTNAVDILAEEAQKLGKIAKVQICLDTGLARVGIPHKEALPFIEKVAAMPEIKIEGIFTSLTEDADYNPVQISRIESVSKAAKEKGIDIGVRHAAATADLDRFPYTYLDMVRPGNCLIGLEPERQMNMHIKPTMSFKARVVYVKKMLKGETLSYMRAYELKKDSIIATIQCGHSDGYPPEVSNKASVLIQGKRFPLIGPITCNHMMADVSGNENIKIGDEVVLWGKQGNEVITKVDLELLSNNDTSAYRMATRTRSYLPRIIK